jgi:hypothetical protein
MAKQRTPSSLVQDCAALGLSWRALKPWDHVGYSAPVDQARYNPTGLKRVATSLDVMLAIKGGQWPKLPTDGTRSKRQQCAPMLLDQPVITSVSVESLESLEAAVQ